jgi:DNA-binding transcriptional regulator PaaX
VSADIFEKQLRRRLDPLEHEGVIQVDRQHRRYIYQLTGQELPGPDLQLPAVEAIAEAMGVYRNG